jgi:hypothetical protein
MSTHGDVRVISASEGKPLLKKKMKKREKLQKGLDNSDNIEATI